MLLATEMGWAEASCYIAFWIAVAVIGASFFYMVSKFK